MKRPAGPGWRKKWAYHIVRDDKGRPEAKRVVSWERRPEWIAEDEAKRRKAS